MILHTGDVHRVHRATRSHREDPDSPGTLAHSHQQPAGRGTRCLIPCERVALPPSQLTLAPARSGAWGGAPGCSESPEADPALHPFPLTVVYPLPCCACCGYCQERQASRGMGVGRTGAACPAAPPAGTREIRPKALHRLPGDFTRTCPGPISRGCGQSRDAPNPVAPRQTRPGRVAVRPVFSWAPSIPPARLPFPSRPSIAAAPGSWPPDPPRRTRGSGIPWALRS